MISLSKCLKEAIFIMMEEQNILKLIVNTITKLYTHNAYRARTFICLSVRMELVDYCIPVAISCILHCSGIL